MKSSLIALPVVAALLLTACNKPEESPTRSDVPASGGATAAPTGGAAPASEVWKDKGAELGARAGETLGTIKDQTSQTAAEVAGKTRELADKARLEGEKAVDAAKELGTKAAEGTRDATQKVVEGTKEAVDKTVEAVQEGVRKLPKP